MFGRCVVVGWDETCQQGEAWVAQNRIRQNLAFGTEQPFYQVLLEADGCQSWLFDCAAKMKVGGWAACPASKPPAA